MNGFFDDKCGCGCEKDRCHDRERCEEKCCDNRGFGGFGGIFGGGNCCWIIILLLLCGGRGFGGLGCGMDCCSLILILILLSCFCGGNKRECC